MSSERLKVAGLFPLSDKVSVFLRLMRSNKLGFFTCPLLVVVCFFGRAEGLLVPVATLLTRLDKLGVVVSFTKSDKLGVVVTELSLTRVDKRG